MTPPRLARWLVGRRVPPGPEGDTIRGDLLEEFRTRAVRRGGAARWWYWRAAVSIALRYRSGRVPPAACHGQAWHDALRRDLRYATRTLLRERGFTVLVVITLALGIGANTAIFSALNAVLLKPLPYPDPDRLVRLVAFNPLQGITRSNVSAPDVLDWRREARSFERIGVFATFSTTLRGRTPDMPAERIAGAGVQDLFDVLGVAPAAGRLFGPGDMAPGQATAAIVSNAIWQRRFDQAGAAIGRPLRPGAATTIVGVMPQGFAYPDKVDLWVPLTIDLAAQSRDNRMYEAIGRLRHAATPGAAQAELDAIALRLDAAYPQTNRGWRVRVVPLTDEVVGDARRTLLLLLGAVGLVMLVACANVAGLCLARGVARRREMAIRSAIGAGRGRVFAQVMTESVMLAAIAGACGVAIGHWGLQLLIVTGGSGIPRLREATLDRTVLVFALAVTVGSGIVFGFLPALQLSRADGAAALRAAGGPSGTRIRGRRAIVVAEVAIALVLLTAAGLVGRSFNALQRIDVGFQPRNLLTFRVTLNGPRYRAPGSDVAYFDELVRRLEAVPGVRGAGAALSLPIGGGGFYLGKGFVRPGRPHPPEGYATGFQIVTPSYLHALGAALLQGREFGAQDGATAKPVAIVNRTFAEHFFGGENPIGQSVFVWSDEQAPREIVGVVADLKPGDLSKPAGTEIFVPLAQAGSGDMTLVVRTADAPAPLAGTVRQVVQRLDPTQAAYEMKTFETILDEALAQRMFGMSLFAGFAGLALILAAVGLYAVMTQLVNGRLHEMGVRMALGAPPASVRRLIGRQAIVLLAAGTAVGLPAAVVSARLLGSLLYDVNPGDPTTLAAVVAVLAAAVAIAAYLPARRATRVDAVSVLRS